MPVQVRPFVPSIEQVVKTVIKIHHKECLFEPDIVDRCVKAVGLKTDSTEIINIIAGVFRECEIYCPIEGIDRRDQFPSDTIFLRGGK